MFKDKEGKDILFGSRVVFHRNIGLGVGNVTGLIHKKTRYGRETKYIIVTHTYSVGNSNYDRMAIIRKFSNIVVTN